MSTAATVSPEQLFLVVAGEASGDLHGAAVLRALRRRAPLAKAFGMGGPGMQSEGLETLHGADEVAVMGITEVLGHLPRLAGILRHLTQEAAARRPLAALLIDLPDFNLRLAKRLRRLGIPVIYYVSPMVWAWREGRTAAIARDVTELLCIYPFEAAFLRERGVNARYVGNPLLDRETFEKVVPPPLGSSAGPLSGSTLGAVRPQPPRHRPSSTVDPHGGEESAPRKTAAPMVPAPSGVLRLALFPGSRQHEVQRLLRPMLEATKLLAARRPLALAIAQASTIPTAALEQELLGAGVTAQIIPGDTPAVLAWSELVLAKSGTVTLEACLAERPMVVVYRVSAVSAWVARRLLKVKSVSLVNLLAGTALVPELLQGRATPAAMAAALEEVWLRRAELLVGYREIRRQLGGPGAADRVVDALLSASAGPPTVVDPGSVRA